MISIFKYGEVPNEQIFSRMNPGINVQETVSEILKQVRTRGDAAVFEYEEKFDHAVLSSLLVTSQEIEEARSVVDPKLLSIMEKAANNIRRFHKRQVRPSFIINEEEGITIGQKIIPLDRAGL